MHPSRIYQPTPNTLAIDWQDGSRSEIGALELRLKCPCSECSSIARSASPTYVPMMSGSAGEIAAIDLIGSSALHVAWRDGHTRSIYRYDFLRSIAPPRSPDTE